MVDKTDNITIRAAQPPEDVAIIVALAELTWAPTYYNILSVGQLNYMFREIYDSESITRQMVEGQQFLLLFYQQTPAGFAAYSALPAYQDYKLNKLYVVPLFHGYGYGKLLIEAVQENVIVAGGKFLELNVNRENKAINFYKKCGFAVDREEDIPIGPYFMNDYVMRKKLI